MNGIMIFYSICGVLIAVLLVRIWSKNRAANLSSRPVTPPPVKAPAPSPIARKQPEPIPVAPPVPVAPPEPPKPIAVVESTVQKPVEAAEDRAATAKPADPPARAAEAAPVSILRNPTSSTWENRRLLDQHGNQAGKSQTAMPRVLAADVPGTDDSDRTFGSTLNPALAALLPDTEVRREAVRKELLAAGYNSPHALENLSATRYALMMLSILVFGGLLLIVPPRLEPWVIAGLVAGPIMGWALPTLQIRRKAADRLREISRAMPDLLDMLNMCVSQGLTVPDALKRILRDFRGIYPALSQELNIVTEQAQINDMPTALLAFSRRIDLPEVHSFTSLLIQTERMGTSISQALTTYSDTMRESLKQRADEKGNRATFRLLFPTVLCLMPAVYLFLLGPAVNELSKFFNAGGRDSLDSGSSAIQRLNAQRGLNAPRP